MFRFVNRFPLLLLVCFLGFAGALRAADSLVWNTNKSQVTADVQTWNLQTLLESIAGATGWDIYVEPKTKLRASAKFKDRAPGEALRLLLGNLSYALVPQTNRPAKLLVFRSSANEATQLVRARRKSTKLDNELIVTMKPGGKLNEKELGAKITGKIGKLNAYRLEFKDAAAAEEARKKLEGDEDVDLVDSNYAITRPADGDALSMSSIPGLDLQIKANAAGDGPIVGLIDTAIQKQAGRDGFILPGVSEAGDATLSSDSPSHGTAMIEAILRGLSMLKDGGKDVAGVRILPVDIYGDAPYASTFQLIQGVVDALKEGANPINMSLGSEGGNELLHRIIKEASDKGVLFFGAAGNEPTGSPTYPGAYPEVMAVTAVDRNGKIAPYANFGNWVDLGAPGSVIVPFNGEPYLVMGTSPATAWATGLATALKASGVPTESIPGKMESIMAVPPQPSK